jgi:hypothetical protein
MDGADAGAVCVGAERSGSRMSGTTTPPNRAVIGVVNAGAAYSLAGRTRGASRPNFVANSGCRP